MKDDFWVHLQTLVDANQIMIDRPKGSTHRWYSGSKFPVDYGYLDGTTSIEPGGVDIWVGSLGEKKVVGALCTVDLLKRDTELKIECDCITDEIQAIINTINTDKIRAIFIKRN